MAERKGKFAALADLSRHPPASAVRPVSTVSETAVAEPGKGRGRPATGKRSNPDWKLYSHYLKRRTQRAAVARLQAEDDGRDLSDVIEDLLQAWLKTERLSE